jgi:hypothetical protein
MTISYNKTWEVMNGLEESFNRISTLEFMIEQLGEAVDNEDQRSVINLTRALQSFMPVYVNQYEKASQRAWNNTVGEVRKLDNPYHSYETDKSTSSLEDVDIDYNELQKFFEDDITEQTSERE